MSITLKLWLCSRTRVDVAVPAWITSAPPARVTRSAALWTDAWWAWPASSRSTPASSIAVERELVTADGALELLADRHGEQRMMGDQHPRGVRIGVRAKVSRMNSTCSSLIRPSLKVNDRAVLIPSTANAVELDERAQASRR